ncbi:MAG: hypothetical protein ACKV22_11265 [Bryobacteraceae bacterium]
MDSFETELLSRRHFLLTSSAALGPLSFLASAEGARNASWNTPANVKLVYLGGHPSWPRPDLDLKEEIASIETRLADVERRYPGQVRFTGGEHVTSPAAMSAWLEQAGGADVILAFNMVTIVFPMLRKLVESNKPAVMFSLPYAGHDWSHAAAFVREGARLELIASSDFADLDEFIPLFRTIHHLRNSKVLLISPPKSHPRSEGYTGQFGTAFSYPTYADLKAIYEGADVAKATTLADEFIKRAARVVEPPRSEIIDSMRLYLAIHELLRSENGNAIAIDCLGGFGRKELPAYPASRFRSSTISASTASASATWNPP